MSKHTNVIIGRTTFQKSFSGIKYFPVLCGWPNLFFRNCICGCHFNFYSCLVFVFHFSEIYGCLFVPFNLRRLSCFLCFHMIRNFSQSSPWVVFGVLLIFTVFFFGHFLPCFLISLSVFKRHKQEAELRWNKMDKILSIWRLNISHFS